MDQDRIEQINEVVEWCNMHGKCGEGDLPTGEFPLIKSKIVIIKQVDGKVLSST